MMTTRPMPTGRSPERSGANRPSLVIRLAPDRNAQSAIVISLGALALAGLLTTLLSSQPSTVPPYRLAEECGATEAMFV